MTKTNNLPPSIAEEQICFSGMYIVHAATLMSHQLFIGYYTLHVSDVVVIRDWLQLWCRSLMTDRGSKLAGALCWNNMDGRASRAAAATSAMKQQQQSSGSSSDAVS